MLVFCFFLENNKLEFLVNFNVVVNATLNLANDNYVDSLMFDSGNV